MKNLIPILLSFLFSYALNAQNISGQWAGVLKVQSISLRIVLHVEQTGETYSATMDSPDQGATGIPVDEIGFENSQFFFKVKAAGIHYTGTFNGNSEISGTFKQSGQAFPLEFSKETESPKVKDHKNPFPHFLITAKR